MGVVYRAREVPLDRDVAVKVLRPEFATHSPTVARFLEEASIAAQLQHPGIPPVHRVGSLPDGRPFIVMKLIKGQTLKELLTEGGDRNRFLAIFEAVAQAMAYAHRRSVIHRDLKPSNIMVGAFGEVQVMDWGLAKVLSPSGTAPVDAPIAESVTQTWIISPRGSGDYDTEAGSVMGTLPFMSPEQAAGELHRIGPPTDVFALGALLCCILTGEAAYTGQTTKEIHLKAVRGQTAEAVLRLDACGADPELLALARRCLAADIAERPADAGGVVSGLAEWRDACAERARRVEQARAATAVAEAARDQAKKLYLTALTAFNRTVFGIQERLEARSGTNDIQRELFAAARSGLDLLLENAHRPGSQSEDGVGAARLSLGAEGTDDMWDGVAGANVIPDDSLGGNFEQFGDQLLQLGLSDEARRAYEKGLAHRLRAAEADPTGADAQFAILGCFTRLAVLELNSGARLRSLEYCNRALEIVKLFPTDSRFVTEEAVILALVELADAGEGAQSDEPAPG